MKNLDLKLKVLIIPFIFLGVFCFAKSSLAANHYIRAGATGAGNGSSWTDAWMSFGAISSGNWVRGDTYYVAGGDYNEDVTIPSKAGTTWIIIKKANAADNRSDPGWDFSYATTQAVINGGWNSTAGYVEVDGVTGSGTSGHGIKIHRTGAWHVVQLSSAGTHHLHHLDLEGPGFAYGSTSIDGIYDPGSVKGLHISYCWIHEIPRNGMTIGNNVGTNYDDYGMLFENNVLSETGGVYIAYPGIHGQGIQISYGAPDAYLIIRNNIFRNILGTAVIAYLGYGTHSQSRIYNNIFYTTDARAGVSRALYWHNLSNSVDGMYIYNNTFYNQNNSLIGCEWTGATNIEVKNNIWVNSFFSDGHRGVTVKSNNDYYNNAGPGVLTGETNQKTESADPFANSSIYDFTPKSTANAVDAGLDLSFVFTADKDGVSRPQGAAWDIGAYEYVSVAPPPDTTPPAAPSGLVVS